MIALAVVKFFALLALFAAVFMAAQLVINSSMSRRAERTAVNERLRMLRTGMDRDEVADILRGRYAMMPQGGLVTRIFGPTLRLLSLADVGTTPTKLLVIAATLTFGALLTIAALVRSLALPVTTGVVFVSLTFALALGVGLPYIYVSRRAQKRTRDMQSQFPIALDIFTRALRAGHPISSALDLLTQEMEDPIGSEFGLVSDEIAYGLDLNTALFNMAAKWGLDDIKMFAVSVSVQGETGGNLAEILNNLSKVIRDRASMYLKVRALSSEGRMSAWMLSIMPVLTFVVLFAMNPAFYLDVAQDPIFTTTFVALLALYAIGVFWMRRLVDLKV